jgi:diamine N-acetyltransferase
MSAKSESDTDDVVALRVVDSDNVRSIIDLSVSEAQAEFVAPNVWSLAEAYAADHVWVRAIYRGAEPVGFVMLSDDDTQPRYYLWRFMIDQRFQGKRYGAAAMELLHDYVRTRPGGDKIFLSYVPADGGPEAFYKGLGYVDTGRIHEGEREAVRDLTR